MPTTLSSGNIRNHHHHHRQPKSSQLVLKVHANPKNLNASAMAAILNADSTLADHADNTLGISINGFEAGSKVRDAMRIIGIEHLIFLKKSS